MFVVFLLFVGSVAAQHDADNVIKRVRVRIAFENGGCDASTEVTLIGHSGPLAERATNDQCGVEFYNVPEGTYHVHVSSKGTPSADLGTIAMTSSAPAEFEVQVKRPVQLDHWGMPASGFVSASDLGAPSRARKEFDRANELIGRQELAEAIKRLNKAISIYPSYALAYNNLAVLYARLGESAREREALQKAIGLNDHFALAYVNLGRMNIAAGDFPAAETALVKASALDPSDPMALILLSWAEFNQRHFDETIAISRKAHALAKPHAFVHRVAARAFEQLQQGANAIAELEAFLQEEPPGPRADDARKELQTVKTILQQLTANPILTERAP
jgi:tetratricopeptide (TPR) repeat protein